MKVTISVATKSISDVLDFRFTKNSSTGAYHIYVYGIAYVASQQVKATYTRPDQKLVGPYLGAWDDDGEDTPVDCYVIDVPGDALVVKGALGISFSVVSAAGIELAVVKAGAYILDSDSLVLPEDLTTAHYNALMILVNALSADKVNVSAMQGGSGETPTKDTHFDSSLKSDEKIAAEVGKVLDGTVPITNLDVNGPADVSGEAEFHEGVKVDKIIETDGDAIFNAGFHFYDDLVGDGASKITQLGAGTDPGDAVIKSQMDTADALKVSKAGDTMSGPLAMGAQKITGLAIGTADTDAVNKGQMDAVDVLKVAKAGDTMSGPLAMGANKVTGLADGSAAQDAVSLLQMQTAIQNAVAAVYRYKGTVATYADLAAKVATAVSGDVWKVLTDETTDDSNVNYAWDGAAWNDLGSNESLATAVADGLMSHEDFAKLNGIEAGAEVNIIEGIQLADSGSDVAPNGNRKVLLPLATITTDGLMPSEDKVELARLETDKVDKDGADMTGPLTVTRLNLNAAKTVYMQYNAVDECIDFIVG